MPKDLSLLRPFDLEKAKQGDPICWYLNSMVVLFIGLTIDREVVYKNQDDFICFTNTDNIKMAPLCWLEDKPVYKGDVLYSHFFQKEFEVTSFKNDYLYANKISDCANTFITSCTWTKPKQKKQGWINVYPYHCITSASWHHTKERADRAAREDRIACVPFEYEE